MIQFMPANHSNINRVITILIYSDKTRFQNGFATLLRRVAKDVTSSLLSWHKHYDFMPANSEVIANENARYKRNELEYKIHNSFHKYRMKWKFISDPLFLTYWGLTPNKFYKPTFVL